MSKRNRDIIERINEKTFERLGINKLPQENYTEVTGTINIYGKIEKKKVYCENCKFLGLNKKNYYICKKSISNIKTALCPKYNLINDVNKNNDCQNYKRKWYLFWK